MLYRDFLKRCAGCTAVVFALSTAPGWSAVHAGDRLRVTVYNHPELSGQAVVSAEEALSLPLAGTVKVHGLETAQVAARIEAALRPYLRYPAVNVELAAQTSSLFVSGGPGGVVRYEPGETLVAALGDLGPGGENGSQGHGLTSLEHSRVDLRRVGITRNGIRIATYDVRVLAARGEGGPTLHPSDTIDFVDKPIAVHILGDVVHPGAAYVDADETIADALDQVGGPAPTAATANLTLRRDDATSTVALGDPVLREPARRGDVLVVPTAPRVSVVGLVERPGPIALKTNFTLLNALYQAGGPTKWADLRRVAVIRSSAPATYDLVRLAHGDVAQNPVLRDGDLVFVPEGHKADVLPIFQSLLPLLYLFPR